MSERKALLLAAGLGTRLRPLTDVLPKCLAPVRGRPLLGYWLDLLDRAGYQRIVVNLHHHADLVRQYVELSPHAGIVQLVHERMLLGTGGTLLANRELLKDGPVLVAHADNLSVFDPLEFLAQHTRRPTGCEMTMMTFLSEDPSSCGVVTVDERGVVSGFFEKIANPPGNIANAAIYIFEQSVFEKLASLRKSFIDLSTDVLPGMVGRAYTYRNRRFHADLGTAAALLAAQTALPADSIGDLGSDPGGDRAWHALLEADNHRLAMEIDRWFRLTGSPERFN